MATIENCGTYKIEVLDTCPNCSEPLPGNICNKCKIIWRLNDKFVKSEESA